MKQKKVWLYPIALLVILMALQCKSSKNLPSQREQYRSIYIDQFKLTYFRLILKKSYNNSNAIQEIISADHSGFTEAILTDADFKLIDSFTTLDNEKMRIDSIQGNQRAEGAQGKRPLGYILDKLNSKWLDSLARQKAKDAIQ